MIPNQTPLSSLEERIEQAVNERMVPLLLANELKRHTRRGRRSCDCEYCKVKRTPIFVYPSQMCQYHFLEMESRVHLIRLKQINDIRKKLNAIKEKFGDMQKKDKFDDKMKMTIFPNGTMSVNLFSVRNVPT